MPETGRPTQHIDIAIELEPLVTPARAEYHHHAQIDQVVEYKVESGHRQKTIDWIEQEKQRRDQREITEPYNIAHSQDAIEPECCWAYLDQVHLTHLVEQVDEDEEAVE